MGHISDLTMTYTKQWQMSHISEEKVHVFSQSSKDKWVSWIRTASYIAWKIIERTELILDTHSRQNVPDKH